MVTLSESFSDGDVLSAGTPGDTDALNGITGQININTLSNIPSKIKFVNADTSVGSHTGSTDETVIGSTTVPAGSISNGIAVFGDIGMSAGGSDRLSTFRLKIGPTGLEVLKTSKQLEADTASNNWAYAPLNFWDNAVSTSSEVTVLITGEGDSTTVTSYCYSLIIMGY